MTPPLQPIPPGRPARFPTRCATGLGILALICVALLTGCGSPRSSSVPLRAIPAPAGTSTIVAPAPTAPTPGPQPLARPVTPAPPVTPLTSTTPDRRPPPQPTWVPIDSLARESTDRQLRRFTIATNAIAELRGPQGTHRLMARTRIAQFNGTNYWLGYAPIATTNGFLVHHVDLNKNLRPFLESKPRSLPAAPPVVVIDPGHGGASPGARSADGQHLEKEFTLDWGLRTAPLLAARGWQVVLTRTNDTELSLPERVAIADATHAQLFISLHFNSTRPRDDLQGLETYCMTPVGLPSTITRDYDDDPETVEPNNSHDDSNLQFAFRLHGALLSRTGAVDRGVRRARFMGVLRLQQRPAVLLEAGYLSNPQEAARIASPQYRQALAQAVADALGQAPTPAASSWARSAAP